MPNIYWPVERPCGSFPCSIISPSPSGPPSAQTSTPPACGGTCGIAGGLGCKQTLCSPRGCFVYRRSTAGFKESARRKPTQHPSGNSRSLAARGCCWKKTFTTSALYSRRLHREPPATAAGRRNGHMHSERHSPAALEVPLHDRGDAQAGVSCHLAMGELCFRSRVVLLIFYFLSSRISCLAVGPPR